MTSPTLPTFIFILLALIVLGLLLWIVNDVRRKRAFSVQDAIALLGIVISTAIALIPLASSSQPAPTATPGHPSPSVVIEGPDAAPLGQKTYFTLTSQNAVRAEWSIGGFGDGKPFVVDPLRNSHQIYVEPTDATRIGDSFVIAVTVYAAGGQAAGATKRFVISQ
jgi:hypothetical protein